MCHIKGWLSIFEILAKMILIFFTCMEKLSNQRNITKSAAFYLLLLKLLNIIIHFLTCFNVLVKWFLMVVPQEMVFLH